MMISHMPQLCTGHYMNYYNPIFKNKELIILINEANGEATDPLDVETLHKAEAICGKYMKEGFIDQADSDALREELEDIFEYGVQLYFANNIKH